MAKRLLFVVAFGGLAAVNAAAGPDAITPIHLPGNGEGWTVSGGVTPDREGNLYGSVSNSRGIFIDPYTRGCGMVFRINAKGMYSTLHDFSSQKHSRGCRVNGELLVHERAIYGVTLKGGTNDHGTVYRLSAKKGHELLHRFDGTDGSMPGEGLTLATDGHLYGVTTVGGQHDAGTIFRIAPSGRFESLYSFAPDDPLGARPFKRLTVGPDGALYGVISGGVDTIYRVGLDGSVSLVKRLDQRDGCLPQALTLGSDGWLYGGALGCGPSGGGTLFRVLPNGSFERLYSFDSSGPASPVKRLTEGPDGTWYGSTGGALPNALATIYKIRFDGTDPTVLHVFNDSVWRGGSSGPLLLADDGWLYGTSGSGGNSKGRDKGGSGMVFRLAP
ncbi:choice-of-anchor tandem repeat GloVer-containing protein [Ideonella sp.]|uniref:choice-of-anchor tandem repeat GloVer-containing protein n=1 Tax=Ideonella sp. TaxID=1929293 RepID=UPI0035AE8EBC